MDKPNIKLIRSVLSDDITFKIDLVEQIEVYDFWHNKYVRCEHWGWNEEGENGFAFFDFGIIGNDFDFEIFEHHIRFYYGDPPAYGFPSFHCNEIVILPRGSNTPEDFSIIGNLSYLDEEYERPKTIGDFYICLNNFYEKTELLRKETQNYIIHKFNL